MPQRLKPFFAVIQWNAIALGVQGAAATVGAVFTSMHEAQQWMAWAIIFDLVSGFLCGCFTRGGLRAAKMGRGIALKSFSFAVVAYLCKQPNLGITINGQPILFGVACALWYVIYEWVSMVENLDELGAPIPPFVRGMLAKAREAVDKIGDAPKDAPGPRTDAQSVADWDRLSKKLTPVEKIGDAPKGDK